MLLLCCHNVGQLPPTSLAAPRDRAERECRLAPAVAVCACLRPARRRVAPRADTVAAGQRCLQRATLAVSWAVDSELAKPARTDMGRRRIYTAEVQQAIPTCFVASEIFVSLVH